MPVHALGTAMHAWPGIRIAAALIQILAQQKKPAPLQANVLARKQTKRGIIAQATPVHALPTNEKTKN